MALVNSKDQIFYPMRCPECDRDLSTLPRDITICPYCGKPISALGPEAAPTKATGLSSKTKKIRKYAKITAMAGVGISATSLFLAFLENQPILLYGVLVGILIVIASAMARSLMKPASAEIYIRKILGILILALALPFVVLFGIVFPVGLITFSALLIPSITMGTYLIRSKRHHLRLDIFWLFLGLLQYAFPPFAYPITPLFTLKGFILTADWINEGVGAQDPLLYLPFFLNVILIFGSAAFLLITDVLSKRWAATRPAKRGLNSTILFVVILGIFFGLPFLYPVGVHPDAIIMGDPHPSGVFRADRHNTSVSFISENNTWIYQIALINKGVENGEIIGIMGKIVSQTVKIGPPFGENIEVMGGEKTAERIVVKPGATVILKIRSKDPLWHITLIEKGNIRWQISFWR